MEITLSEMPEPDTVIDADAQQYLLYALCGLPNGVLAMSPTMPGMVETSTNLASVKFVGDRLIEITTSRARRSKARATQRPRRSSRSSCSEAET